MKTKINFRNARMTMFVVCTSLLFNNRIIANYLQIGVPAVSTNTISFTVQWDNSWKVTAAPSNWDAVWVFVKYQQCSGSNVWQHVDLSAPNTVTGGVLQVDNVGDNKGVFIRRIADGTGNIASATVTLTMSFADGGYNYQVFGMEMVNIPTGSFWIGDGSSSNSLISSGPVQITSTDAPSMGGVCSGGDPPAAYPEGYENIYCMKYEITQEQYVGFLNTLTYDQQVTRTAAVPSSPAGTLVLTGGTQNRNGIIIETPGVLGGDPAKYANDLTPGTYNNTNDGQNIALNWIMWNDLLAYLDWAALRPMTEMEYEKICRGPVVPTNNEYPWGNNSSLTQARSNSLTNPQTASEISTASGVGLCAYGNGTGGNYGPGPLRVGFAATATTTRVQAGATYYGVLDMSGNMHEQCILVSTTTFTTASGDGTLDATGNANVANWPAYNGGICRGGAYLNGDTRYLKISDRTSCSNAFQFRDKEAGGRGVRTY